MLVGMLGQDYNKTIGICYHFLLLLMILLLWLFPLMARGSLEINFHLSYVLSLLTWVCALVLTQESIKSDSHM